ncbi:heterogeneous nuclear ribonucleoprotein K-like [Uloborus diversus]|uniref:heterogeneous nuclear ribonucleoprotein K-like n=1 Tax=Uloborus diversus TaxID=327109 RepID=UPI00240A77A2|nr:heterogeneous nuclear ribonucleoprotein K-like [Uloborus diversus]XP_054709926.1 heterogeneous nuclear ribonucleoprotein K-like [Uloborus diversus]
MTDSDSYKSLKREAQDDMDNCEGPSKRPRSGGRAVDIRFLVQSKNAGAIIGKGGSNINRLRTEFTASVTVPDCPGPERILAIVADIETLGDILLDILPKLDDYSHHHNMEFDCELRMLLHQSHAGCLIGKGGSRIKELREKTGAQIKIFSNCCPNSTERVVQITGYPNVAVDCVKEICHIISQAPIKGANKQYDPHHFNPMFSSDYGGFEDSGSKGRGRGSFRGGFGGPDGGSGRGRGGFGGNFGGRGRGIMGQGPNMGNRWNQMGPGNTGGGNTGGWGGSGSNFGNRMMGNMNGANSGNFMPQGDKPMGPGMGGPRPPMMSSGMGFQGAAGGPGMNGPPARFMGGPVRPMKPYNTPVPNTGELFSSKPVMNPSNGMYSIVMKIPNDVAGAIIGKGGQRIRKIRRDSAANINIEEATQSTNTRIITITGALQQAQLAQFLMQQSVRENQGSGGGGGGRRF